MVVMGNCAWEMTTSTLSHHRNLFTHLSLYFLSISLSLPTLSPLSVSPSQSLPLPPTLFPHDLLLFLVATNHNPSGVATVIDVSCGGCHTMVIAKPVNPQDAAPESPPKHPVTAPLQDATPEVKSYARMKRQSMFTSANSAHNVTVPRT